ncbi:hypothetical protein BJ508DRAFT_328358 [Ascobolus immersus RN42]|uniref:Uncharacterized protein n=1 Tax=Ascobolus immersus RN42 TaxID=1160509 RepID=A0A3N4I0G5_ASCIM|nr:hypothetical protein BJ508DRAFT_328358 [Ascobolus immersus RN42]
MPNPTGSAQLQRSQNIPFDSTQDFIRRRRRHTISGVSRNELPVEDQDWWQIAVGKATNEQVQLKRAAEKRDEEEKAKYWADMSTFKKLDGMRLYQERVESGDYQRCDYSWKDMFEIWRSQNEKYTPLRESLKKEIVERREALLEKEESEGCGCCKEHGGRDWKSWLNDRERKGLYIPHSKPEEERIIADPEVIGSWDYVGCCYTTGLFYDRLGAYPEKDARKLPPLAKQIRLYGHDSFFPVPFIPPACDIMPPIDNRDALLLKFFLENTMKDPVWNWCNVYMETRPAHSFDSEVARPSTPIGYNKDTGRILSQFLDTCEYTNSRNVKDGIVQPRIHCITVHLHQKLLVINTIEGNGT